RWANASVGSLCSLLTFTPFALWRRHHAAHHAVWNNLDKRPGGSDIYSSCMTLQEYEALSPLRQRLSRAALHPLVAQVLLPPVLFLLLYRVLLGWQPVLLVQLPVMVLASITGVWLFAVQHRFEGSLWARQAEWSPMGASLHGSSYF